MATTYTWNNVSGGDFSTAGDWTPAGGPPTTGDTADLVALTGAYTVTEDTGATIASIETAASRILSITSGAFTVTAGTGGGANAGTISVGDNTTFNAGGTFDNTGSISLVSQGNNTNLVVAAGGLTLSGAGSVTLDDRSNNRIYGATAASTLTNTNDTISGAGQFGVGGLTLINQAAGVIDATGASNALVLSMGAGKVTNSGLIESTGAAGLTIQSTTVDGSGGGTIQANTGSAVSLASATLIGGTLKTVGTGAIQTTDTGSMLDGSTSTVNNQGTLNINDNTRLTIQGVINNTGSINLVSQGNNTDLQITATNATLQGAGTVTLDDRSNNRIYGATAASTLTNVNDTISGAGQFGIGQLTLINQASGVIDATGVSNALVLNTGAQKVTNSGLIEATGVGGLTITGGTTINDSTGGVIQAVGSNVKVLLFGSTIIGGTLKSSSGGEIVTNGGTNLLDAITAAKQPVTNQANLVVADNTALRIQGAINNSSGGTITLSSQGNNTDLVVTALNASIAGDTVTLDDRTNNRIYGTITGKVGHQKVSSLTVKAKTIIAGAGQFGVGQLKLTNAGTIDATGSNALVLRTGGVTGANVVKNTGLLESTNPGALGAVGGLVIVSTNILAGSIKGVIEANGAHTHVDLQSATITGGILKTLAGGVIQTTDTGSLLDGSTLFPSSAPNVVNNQGTLNINDNTRLSIQGVINNTGSINLVSQGNNTDLEITATNATLQGAGTVALDDRSNNRIFGNTAGSTLTNVNDTISGSGQFGAGQLTLVNQASGVINATGASNALVLNTGAQKVTNAGLIEATGAQGLTIQSTTVDGSSGGVIQANTGSVVDLATATLFGGTLKIAGTGVFQTTDTGSLLDGSTSTVNNQGTLNILDNTQLSIQGTINNTGAIDLNSQGNNTNLVVTATNATLQGAGAVTLDDRTNNRVFGATGASTLTNVNDTISGSGQLGAGQLTLVNQASGVIDATGASNALVLNTGSSKVTNGGLLEATGAAGLTIQSTTVDGSSGGVIQANTGSVVDLASADLFGGTLKIAGTGVFQTTDGGSLLDGSTSTVNNQGTLNILDNTQLSIQGKINNTGAINLNSQGNNTNLVVTATNATLQGSGTVTLDDRTNNRILGSTAASTLTNVNDTISGAGQIGAGQMTFVNQGTVNATGTNALTLNTGANAITNSGTLEATGAGGMTVSSALTNNGTLKANGGTLDVTAAVSGTGSATIVSGTLQLGSTFNQNVTFSSTSGVLDLANSQGFTSGTVTGFSHTGGTSFDLRDIGFVSAGEATFSGTSSGGTLKVTDGTHTANIKLVGDYTAATWTASSDGHGGTTVVDPTPGFVSAMAGFGSSSGSGSGVIDSSSTTTNQPLLTAPR
jgi:hypothetical protein